MRLVTFVYHTFEDDWLLTNSAVLAFLWGVNRAYPRNARFVT